MGSSDPYEERRDRGWASPCPSSCSSDNDELAWDMLGSGSDWSRRDSESETVTEDETEREGEGAERGGDGDGEGEGDKAHRIIEWLGDIMEGKEVLGGEDGDGGDGRDGEVGEEEGGESEFGWRRRFVGMVRGWTRRFCMWALHVGLGVVSWDVRGVERGR